MFAKLFDTSRGQVLVTVEECYDDDEGEELFPLSIRWDAPDDGPIIRMAPGYRTYEEQQLAFTTADQDFAEKAAETASNMLARLVTKDD